MTLTTEPQLTRPRAAADQGPLDDKLYDLVEARFRRIVRDNPVVGTYLGIHTEDDRLGDGSQWLDGRAGVCHRGRRRRQAGAVENADDTQ